MEMGEEMCVTRRRGVADAFNQRVRGSVEKEGEEVNPLRSPRCVAAGQSDLLRQATAWRDSAARRQKG